MNTWKCDVCGKETMLNPPVEQVFEEKNGQQVPVFIPVTSMDFSNGQMVTRMMPKTKDLAPRCYIVKLNAGPVQTIQRDFCETCYQSLLPKINDLWKALEQIGSK